MTPRGARLRAERFVEEPYACQAETAQRRHSHPPNLEPDEKLFRYLNIW